MSPLRANRMIPAPLRQAAAWWRGMSEPDKFRLYTWSIMQSVLVAVVVAIATSKLPIWVIGAVALSGFAAICGLESHPVLSVRASPRQQRWAARFAVVTLSGMWVASLALALFGSESARQFAVVTAGSALMLFCTAVLPFLRYRIVVLLVATAITAVTLDIAANTAVVFGLLTLAGLATMLSTQASVWGVRVLTELERSKQVAVDLQVAQERLRFSRDLHDVVGRGFSAVAVKSELALTLLRTGDTDRAATEVAEVKSLAVTSMEEMRSLVRGYRDVDLGGEVAGARSLLRAAGCNLSILGQANEIPGEFREVAAWVVREGTTNIVKHSTASRATLVLRPDGLDLRNDGVRPTDHRAGSLPTEATTGLTGLSERVTAAGATLSCGPFGDGEFQLTVAWDRPNRTEQST